jgi:pilus assembly protein Flp/PilA
MNIESSNGRRPISGRKEVKAMLSGFERGQGLVEYALILALIAVVVFAVLALLGSKVNNKYNALQSSFP